MKKLIFIGSLVFAHVCNADTTQAQIDEQTLLELSNLKKQQRLCQLLNKENLKRINTLVEKPNYIGNYFEKFKKDIWLNLITKDNEFLITPGIEQTKNLPNNK